METDLFHVSIYIYDIQDTIKFYKRLFDAEVLYTKEMKSGNTITMFRIGSFELEAIWVPDEGERLRICQLNNMTPNHFALSVENIDLLMDNVEILGADIEDDIREIELPPGTKARVAFIHGPSGERIELYQKC